MRIPIDAQPVQNDYINNDDLVAYGLTPGDVARRCPWAVEYTGLNGRPCWRADDLTTLLSDPNGTGGRS